MPGGGVPSGAVDDDAVLGVVGLVGVVGVGAFAVVAVVVVFVVIVVVVVVVVVGVVVVGAVVVVVVVVVGALSFRVSITNTSLLVDEDVSCSVKPRFGRVMPLNTAMSMPFRSKSQQLTSFFYTCCEQLCAFVGLLV